MNWTSLALALAVGQVSTPDRGPAPVPPVPPVRLAPPSADNPPAAPLAEGTWSVAYMESNGQPVALRNNSVVTIRGNVMTFLTPDGQDLSLRLEFGPQHVLRATRIDPDRSTGRPVPLPAPAPAPPAAAPPAAPVPNPGRGSNPANPDGTRGGPPLGGTGGSGVGGTGTGSTDRGAVGSATPPLGGVGTRAEAVRTGGNTGVYVLTRDYLVLDFGGTLGSVPFTGKPSRGSLDEADYGTPGPRRNDAERVGATGTETPGGPKPPPGRGSPGPVGTGGLGTGDTTPRGVGGGTAPDRRDRGSGAADVGPSPVSRAFVMILRRGTAEPTLVTPPANPDPRVVPRAPPRP